MNYEAPYFVILSIPMLFHHSSIQACSSLKHSVTKRIRVVVVSRDSSVGIALGYKLDDRGFRFRFPAGLGNFLITTASRTALGPIQPPIKWVSGAVSLEVKRPGREADHSSPSSAEVKE
jgi:hypothetical protein